MIFEGGRDLDLLPEEPAQPCHAWLLTTIGKWLLAVCLMACLIGVLFVTGD